VYPIESAEDLSLQTAIEYGCVGGGSTQSFFTVISFFTSNFICIIIFLSELIFRNRTYQHLAEWANL
jgi:hypothetical protein